MEIVNPLASTEPQGSHRIAAALREASERLEAFRRQSTEPLAVVGMACRFPGADSPDMFWQSLIAGRCAIGEVPADRWDAQQYHADQPKQAGRVTFNGGGFVSEIDRFDPKFFEITHREARSMDPQQRLMLEAAWEALEHAGILPEQWFGRCGGVFAGMCSSDYLLRLRSTGPEAIDPYFSTGNAHGAAAGRLSYFLKWQGPSIAVDTACSSSLVAVHLAMQSLRNQECDIALAMGVNVILAPDLSISLSQAGMLSPSGVSRTFASGADGFVRGEGCGAVLLKRLSDAQRDGDQIFCVLKGSAVNQDGRSNGLTAPNGPAQRDAIRQALRRAALQPDEIDYIETHGTGTELGDPIEVGAITEVFAPRQTPLWIGSVKTNIGHLEGAAGIAGLIKTCLSLHQQTLPQHLHFDQPSPHIDWQPQIQVAAQAIAWPRRSDRVRRAGVSSFGFGGTNAHVIVEEAPPIEPQAVTALPATHIHWLKVSGKTPSALRNLADRYADSIEQGVLRGADLCELAISANVGRSDWPHRAVVRYRNVDELVAGLRSVAAQTSEVDTAETSSKLAEALADWQSWVASTGGVITTSSSDTNAISFTVKVLTPDQQHVVEEAMSRLMELYQLGASIDWPAVMGTRRRTLSLPTYPFERQRCWYRSGDESPQPKTPKTPSRSQSLLGTRLDLASESIVFETDISGFVELADHRVGDTSVFPAAGYLDLACAAAKTLGDETSGQLYVNDLRLLRPLSWITGQPARVQVVIDATGENEYAAKVLSRQSGGWQLHATCRFSPDTLALSAKSPMESAILENKTISPDEHYDRCDRVGLRYSGVFRSLKRLNVTASGAEGEVALPIGVDPSGYVIHPALLDGCFQGIAGLMSDHHDLWLPVSVGRYEVTSPSIEGNASLRFNIVESAPATSTTRQFDLTVTNTDGTLVAKIFHLVVKRVSSSVLSSPQNDSASAIVSVGGTPSVLDSSSINDETCASLCGTDSSAGGFANACSCACGEVTEDPLLVRLRNRLSMIIECDEAELDLDTPLENLGFDSMMAIEMLDALEKDFGVKIPTDQFWSGLTLGGLLERVRNQASAASDANNDSVQWVEGTL